MNQIVDKLTPGQVGIIITILIVAVAATICTVARWGARAYMSKYETEEVTPTDDSYGGNSPGNPGE